jgi:hypothetical protein
MNYCSDFKTDLIIGQEGEKYLGGLLKDSTIEVKTDFMVDKTGNVAIEYESRGKPSGISTTQSSHWAIIFSGQYNKELTILIEVNRLKRISREYYKKGKVVKGGDNNTSKLILIPIEKLLKLF